MKWVLMVFMLLVVVIALLVGWGQWRWGRLTQDLVTRLEAGIERAQPTRFDEQQLLGLPPVVQRFFRAALQPGAPMVASVALEHDGTFNMSDAADQWMPFTSHQRVVTRRPGFVWDAQVSMAPGLAVHVHDAYVAGEGVLHPAILGLVTLTHMRGGGELARGELMRYVAETPWYPTALLPSEGVSWEPIDDRSARATFKEREFTLVLTFSFGPGGLIESVRAEARGRTVGDQILMRPWEGRFSNYALRDGMRVPLSGEVAWLLPEAEGGRKPYWRGAIRSVRYEMRQ